MAKSNRIVRGAAIFAGCLMLMMVLLPLANVGLAASLETWRRRGQDNYSTSTILVEAVQARTASSGITLINLPAPRLENCDIDIDRLPQWANGEDRFWARWGPAEAISKARAVLLTHADAIDGSTASRTRYVADHTSELERRFLLGCISGTLTAPICASRVQSLMSAADQASPPLDIQQRMIDLKLWNEKTLCALARGLSQTKLPVIAQQRPNR